MTIDLHLFASKLKRLREDLKRDLPEVSKATGIPLGKLRGYESGEIEPTGDHVLILADYYVVDYPLLISNERKTPFEQASKLFRQYGSELSASDRLAIQEFLLLCEAEANLQRVLNRAINPFSFNVPTGKPYWEQASSAAAAFRKHNGYSYNHVIKNLYDDLRRSGFHVFRRRLQNSNISGVYVHHPIAGKCILVNYDEDVYRQNFTLAHETGHGILDDVSDAALISFFGNSKDTIERRANAFAGEYFVPRELLRNLPKGAWTPDRVTELASRLSVSTQVITYALKRAGLISEELVATLIQSRVPRDKKVDPELAGNLSTDQRKRGSQLLERGISRYFAQLCFDAYRAELISFAKLAELFFVDESEAREIANLFNEALIVI